MAFGIYKIQSVIKPERIYIGSSVDIESRWYVHKSDFKNKRRHSIHFQRHYDKYGEGDLIYSVIEEMIFPTKEELLTREQYYIDLYNPYFNGCKVAGSPLGYKHTEETKRKKSELFKKMGHKPPSTKGIKWGADTGRKHRDINIKLGLIPPSRKGVKRTEEEKAITREKRRQKQINN